MFHKPGGISPNVQRTFRILNARRVLHLNNVIMVVQQTLQRLSRFMKNTDGKYSKQLPTKKLEHSIFS